MRTRKQLRLKNWDYATPSYYFVTICTQDRECLFGDVVDGKMVLNKCGMIVKNEWLKTQSIRENVMLDEYQIMPNHIHGIVVITHRIGGPNRNRDAPHRRGVGAYCNTPLRKFESPSNDLGAIIRGFKSTTTKQINTSNGTPGKRIWQRNYYENIIRNEKSLHKIRRYIGNNPGMWERDRNNPKNF